jgi:hypothetical protein
VVRLADWRMLQCYRESDAERDHRPVCRIVETRPPDGAAVNLSAIEVCKRANRGRVELVWARSWCDRFHALTASPEMTWRTSIALLGGLSLGSKGEAPSTPHAGLGQLMRSGLVTTPAFADVKRSVKEACITAPHSYQLKPRIIWGVTGPAAAETACWQCLLMALSGRANRADECPL